jgi:hypothetical protein
MTLHDPDGPEPGPAPRLPHSRDPRPFVKISVDLPFNPKLAAVMADHPLAGWAQVTALCYCRQSFTDGHFPAVAVERMAGTDDLVTKAMVAEDIWHEAGHGCDRCPQPRKGRLYLHDYLEHQPSAEDIKALSKERSKNGRAGADSRWGTPEERAARKAARAAEAAAAKKPAKTATKSTEETPVREDVERLCNYLADWVKRNGGKDERPPVGKGWHDAARLLIDRDKNTVEEIREVIRWCQLDEFWKDNILSMPTLRKKFEQLQRKMRTEQTRGTAPQRRGAQPGVVNYDGQNQFFEEAFGGAEQGELPLPKGQPHAA